MRTRLILFLLIAGVVTSVATGCAGSEPGLQPSADAPTCRQTMTHRLGFVRGVDGTWPSFRSAGGEVWVGARGLEENTALGPVRMTRVSLVDASEKPRFRGTTSVVLNPAVTVDVRSDGVTKVEVPAGRYRVVSSNGGNLRFETCADGVVEQVHVAQRAAPVG